MAIDLECCAAHSHRISTVSCQITHLFRYSRNSDVVAAVARFSVFTVPCHATQLALADVLSDVDFTRQFLSASAEALRGAWLRVRQVLRECSFDYLEPSAGVFV